MRKREQSNNLETPGLQQITYGTREKSLVLHSHSVSSLLIKIVKQLLRQRPPNGKSLT